MKKFSEQIKGLSLPDYTKSIRIVESCETLEHLASARRYINLFFRKYSRASSTKEYTIDRLVGSMYDELLTALDKKKKALRKKYSLN